MNVGLLGYGSYIPSFRLATEDIASVWGKQPAEIQASLGIRQKSVPSIDEDTVTLAFEAASEAVNHACILPTSIQACFVGSESHPYAVNPTSTIVAEFLGCGHEYIAADLEFACKAGTAGMWTIAGLIEAGIIQTGLAIGSDAAQSRPHDVLEYTAASAACAYVLGTYSNESVARLVDMVSYSSDTPDFWRRDGVRFPTHGGRFTGEPAYFTHVVSASELLLKKTGKAPSDFDYCVFHMPNGKFPREVARRLGFTKEQLESSLIVDYIGNPYSASTMLGLSAVLDIASPGETIFMVSYGSGAGSDGFIFEVTKSIGKKRKLVKSFQEKIDQTKQISYVDYLKFSKKI